MVFEGKTIIKREQQGACSFDWLVYYGRVQKTLLFRACLLGIGSGLGFVWLCLQMYSLWLDSFAELGLACLTIGALIFEYWLCRLFWIALRLLVQQRTSRLIITPHGVIEYWRSLNRHQQERQLSFHQVAILLINNVGNLLSSSNLSTENVVSDRPSEQTLQKKVEAQYSIIMIMNSGLYEEWKIDQRYQEPSIIVYHIHRAFYAYKDHFA